MDFTIDQHVDATVDVVEQLLLDPDFVAATSALPRLGDCKVLASERDGDVVNVRIHRRFDAPLSAAVRRVVDPGNLTWTEVVAYDLGRHRGDHRILPDAYADRLKASFSTLLTDDGGGTVRRTQGRMQVRAPLVGGKIEGAIVSGLQEYAAAEADLLSEWAGRG